jgi:Cd2+/Zn2+-exporting ATPase
MTHRQGQEDFMHQANGSVSKSTWMVDGMDCSGCKAKIERVLGKTTGVVTGNVNFMSKQMTVEFDSKVVSADQLARTVSGLGFEVTSLDDPKGDKEACPANESDARPLYEMVSVNPAIARTLYWNAKAKDVALAAGLLLSAWAFGMAFPAQARWIWSAATLMCGWPVFKRAFSSARAGVPFSIESLMTVAALGAILIGAMEEAALVIVLFLFGEWLESVATAKARSGIQALFSLAPASAWLMHNSQPVEVAASSLIRGDLIQVRPGDRVPTDGLIVEGESLLDESLLTGELVPVSRRAGEAVSAGTLNGDGRLLVRVEATTENNTIARIRRLIELAESEKGTTARFIDRFSSWYTPAIFALAILVALVPPLVSGDGDFKTWIYRALGLLLIGCPCALVLSVPATVTSAIARGTRMGLLVKGGAALEAIGGVKIIAFDKTGTLTKGAPALVGVYPLEGTTRYEVLSVAASIEQSASHPLARAIVAAAKAESLLFSRVENAQALPGSGLQGTIGARKYAVLSPRAMQESPGLALELNERKEHEEELGRTVVGLLDVTTSTPRLLGLLSLADSLRDDAAQAISELKTLGVRPILLTGDNARAAMQVGTTLGIEVKSELRPDEKLAALRSLKLQGKTAMVGDGINDAPALAAADVGISMGSGTDVAVESADAVLHHDNLRGVVELVRLSRRAKAVIMQNIAFALGLKGVFLVTTLFGLTGLWLAVLSDTGATVLVTLNALRLLMAPRSNGA